MTGWPKTKAEMPAWFNTMPTAEDLAYWNAEQRWQIQFTGKVIDGMPRESFRRSGALPKPRYEQLKTNGDWAAWCFDLDRGIGDVFRACGCPEEENRFADDRIAIRVPPSARLKKE